MIVSFVRRFHVICQLKLWVSEMRRAECVIPFKCWFLLLFFWLIFFSIVCIIIIIIIVTWHFVADRFYIIHTTKKDRKCRNVRWERWAWDTHFFLSTRGKLSRPKCTKHQYANKQTDTWCEKSRQNERARRTECEWDRKRVREKGNKSGSTVTVDEHRVFWWCLNFRKSKMDSSAQSQKGVKWMACVYWYKTLENKHTKLERELCHMILCKFHANEGNSRLRTQYGHIFRRNFERTKSIGTR